VRETKDASNPVGAWNTARLVMRDGLGEHWVNGQLVCSYDVNSPDFEQLPEKKAFKRKAKGYADIREGSIGLQTNSGKIEYRNIRIRSLLPKP
jgi:hypothetical protein